MERSIYNALPEKVQRGLSIIDDLELHVRVNLFQGFVNEHDRRSLENRCSSEQCSGVLPTANCNLQSETLQPFQEVAFDMLSIATIQEIGS